MRLIAASAICWRCSPASIWSRSCSGIVVRRWPGRSTFRRRRHIFTFSEFGLLYIVMAASPWLVRHARSCLHRNVHRRPAPYSSARASVARGRALCVVICLVLVWYTWGDDRCRAYKFGDADMRRWTCRNGCCSASMPICFGLMALQFPAFRFRPGNAAHRRGRRARMSFLRRS